MNQKVVAAKIIVTQWQDERSSIIAWLESGPIGEFILENSIDLYTEKFISSSSFEKEIYVCAILKEEDATFFHLKFGNIEPCTFGA